MMSDSRECYIGWASQDLAKTPLALKPACLTGCSQPKLQAAKRRKLMKAKMLQQLLFKVSHDRQFKTNPNGVLHCS